jgi:hypothetical protein
MNEIKAGPELDESVAEAIGLKLQVRYGVSQSIYVREWFELIGKDVPDGFAIGGKHADMMVTFDPSQDLNMAVAAAEKIGLFDKYALTRLGGVWRITPAVQGLWFADPVLATGDTPALAICAAILKAKA